MYIAVALVLDSLPTNAYSTFQQLLTTFSATDEILGRGPSDIISSSSLDVFSIVSAASYPHKIQNFPSLTSLLFISLIITIDYHPQQPRMSSNTFGASTLTFASFRYLGLCKKWGLGLLLTWVFCESVSPESKQFTALTTTHS
jgi:hypothetical protein